VFGAATGQTPTISPQGSDTNIPLGLSSKGTSALTFYTNAFGNIQFNIANTASAVNYLQVTGAVTTGYPSIVVAGSDTNIGLVIQDKGTSGIFLKSNSQSVFVASNVSGSDFTNYYTTTGSLNYTAAGGSTNINFYFGTKGTGSIQLATGGGTQLLVANTASAVNYLQVTGGTTGNPAKLSAQGSDADISIQYLSKGVGGHIFYNSAGYPQFFITQTASAVNYLNATGAVTTGAPVLSAAGSDANIDLALTPKGTGVLAFGTYTAGVVAQAGYITIKDAGGTTRRLLVG
jgi:hypothetical protein